MTEAWSYVTRILLFEVNYALKSTLSTLTYTRNAPVDLLRRYQEILSGSRGEGVLFTGTVSEREEVGPNKTDLGQQQQRYCALY